MSAKPMEVVLQTVVYFGRFYKNDEKKRLQTENPFFAGKRLDE